MFVFLGIAEEFLLSAAFRFQVAGGEAEQTQGAAGLGSPGLERGAGALPQGLGRIRGTVEGPAARDRREVAVTQFQSHRSGDQALRPQAPCNFFNLLQKDCQ